MPTMAIPSFLAPASPPRSPHVAHRGYFDSYFAQATPSTQRSRPTTMFRPTRRDLLLCFLTLSFSYLLFSSPPTADLIAVPSSVGSQTQLKPTPPKYRLPGWSTKWTNIFHSGDKPNATPLEVYETSFTDSVKTYGFAPLDEIELEDDRWDGGEEMAEDDELVGGETVLVAHQPGWTIFDKLYVYNGSFYVVTDDTSEYPELRLMTSTGLPALNVPGNEQAREPKGDEILYITPIEAAKLWGPRVYRMEGVSWLFNDGQFIDHYYHFAAELLLGMWRSYASLDPDITAQGVTSLPPPRRIWFLHQDEKEWRDKPRFNPTILFSLFPSVSILYPSDFADIKQLTSSHLPTAYMLDRAILADRSAAFRGPYTAPTARTVAGALHVGHASRWFWEPIRRQVLRYSGVSEGILDRSLEGLGATDPALLEGTLASPGVGVPELEPLTPPGDYKPLVTYISRQSSRRHLTPESHDALVKAVTARAEKLGFDFMVVEAEKLSKEEQFALAARTTIMLGVHGNGLTHLLWMPPTPRSTVIEMFFQGGFARDYQWTAHALGIRHYGVAHDVAFTSPNLPNVAYPEGFQGTSITVDANIVADLIENRLNGTI